MQDIFSICSSASGITCSIILTVTQAHDRGDLSSTFHDEIGKFTADYLVRASI